MLDFQYKKHVYMYGSQDLIAFPPYLNLVAHDI